MILGHLDTSPTALFLSILGFSLFIAGLDFAKRRAANRALARVSESGGQRLDELSKLPIVAAQTNPVVESRPIGPLAGIAGLPHLDRAAASLPFGNFLPLPRPTPRMPRDLEVPNQPVSWSL
jgi:hypothetical protein